MVNIQQLPLLSDVIRLTHMQLGIAFALLAGMAVVVSLMPRRSVAQSVAVGGVCGATACALFYLHSHPGAMQLTPVTGLILKVCLLAAALYAFIHILQLAAADLAREPTRLT